MMFLAVMNVAVIVCQVPIEGEMGLINPGKGDDRIGVVRERRLVILIGDRSGYTDSS